MGNVLLAGIFIGWWGRAERKISEVVKYLFL